MATYPGFYQVLLDTKTSMLKYEIFNKFGKLQCSGRAAIRVLELKDCVEIGAFYKIVGKLTYGRKGIRVLENQILIHLFSEEQPRELGTVRRTPRAASIHIQLLSINHH